MFAQQSRLLSLIPVFSASALRPFGSFAASSSLAVVLIPWDFRVATMSGSMPAISAMGCDIDNGSSTLRLFGKFISDELTKAGNGTDDFANHVLARLLAGICNGLFGDALNLPHAQSRGHKFSSNPHNAAHQTRKSTGTICRSLCCGFSAGHLAQQCLNLVRGTFIDEEREDDADRFLGHRAINTNVC